MIRIDDQQRIFPRKTTSYAPSITRPWQINTHLRAPSFLTNRSCRTVCLSRKTRVRIVKAIKMGLCARFVVGFRIAAAAALKYVHDDGQGRGHRCYLTLISNGGTQWFLRRLKRGIVCRFTLHCDDRILRF